MKQLKPPQIRVLRLGRSTPYGRRVCYYVITAIKEAPVKALQELNLRDVYDLQARGYRVMTVTAGLGMYRWRKGGYSV